jgi:hypothetical protein
MKNEKPKTKKGGKVETFHNQYINDLSGELANIIKSTERQLTELLDELGRLIFKIDRFKTQSDKLAKILASGGLDDKERGDISLMLSAAKLSNRNLDIRYKFINKIIKATRENIRAIEQLRVDI